MHTLDNRKGSRIDDLESYGCERKAAEAPPSLIDLSTLDITLLFETSAHDKSPLDHFLRFQLATSPAMLQFSSFTFNCLSSAADSPSSLF